ncbi:hypothetical protein KJS94_06775 [Flavihumibacter rivuli]|uniref:AsmA-like C-terminal region-containing protein n=1 Tax=Flavihumibacter rivuli TaxID=2838156 RepID=UPI001BDEAB81|nr:AsmA-like C-terminal region-containing protein [Flavihumibacter rivuli]ULQ57901.1 hypothetical protein KJS94_06775 [Flavihumibacter rivuli]
MLKKTLLIVGGIVLFVLVAAAAAPLLFKDKLVEIAKKEINNQLDAKVAFRDVSVSLFRRFPRLSVGLEELSVSGNDRFMKDTLIAARQIDIVVNLFSLLGSGPVSIKKVVLEEPRIHAIIDKDGKTNWDIMKADTAAQQDTHETGAFHLKLNNYAINNGRIKYEDRQGNMDLEIEGLEHEGSGDLTADEFTLNTSTSTKATNFTYEGIPWLSNVRSNIDADLKINTTTGKYAFEAAKLSLNDLEVNADGYFQLVNDSTYGMDIRFNTPSNDFKSLLSLVPAIYKNDFDQIKTSGTASFSGMVKGTYSPTRLPAYDVKAQVKDGAFHYPGLPMQVSKINLDLQASNADGQPDNTVINIPQASLLMGKEPFQFHLLYKQPLTAQFIDMAAKGKLDLSTIDQFIKLAAGTVVKGLVDADIKAKGNLNVVLQQKPGPFQAEGLIKIANLYYASAAFPQPIQNTNAIIQVSNPDGIPDNTVVNIPSGHVEFGADKVDFDLLLKQPASDPYFDAGVKGSFDLARVKQFYSFEPGTSLAGKLNGDIRVKGRKSMVDKEQYQSIDLGGSVLLNQVDYKTPDYPEGLQLRNATITMQPGKFRLVNSNGSFMGTNFSATGDLTNAIGYALKDEPLSGSLNMQADKVDLNKWMGTPVQEEGQPTEGSGPFLVPANINFTVNAAVDQVKYDNTNYNNVRGNLQIANETVDLRQVNMDALGGNIGLKGSYSTRQEKSRPAISLSYDLANLDVQQTFKAFNTVKYLAPVAEFISGKLNSSLTMNGHLGETMMPDLASLTGKGNLLLLEGVLSKFAPLEQLANKLQLTDLKQISVKDIKQYIEFVNGKVLVKPYKVKVKDIDMEIGGMHGFDQSLDYIVNLKVPRDKLGKEANQLVNGLAAEFTKKGLPVSMGETVSLKVKLGGTIKNPSFTYNLQDASNSLANELEQKAKDIAAEQKAKVDSIATATKKAAKDSLNTLKQQALADAQKSLQEKLSGKKDSASSGQSTQKRAEEMGKDLLNNLLRKKKKGTDSTRAN